jgi:hypothetical protein
MCKMAKIFNNSRYTEWKEGLIEVDISKDNYNLFKPVIALGRND